MNINRDSIIIGDVERRNNNDKLIYTNNENTGIINFDRGNLKMACLGVIPDDTPQYIIGVDTLDGNKLTLQTRPLGGGGGGGGDVFLNGNVATSKNIFGAGVTNEYQHKELYITGAVVDYNTGSNINLNTGSSIDFKDTAQVKFSKNIIPSGNGKYLVTDALGVLQSGLSVIPITDVDGLVATLSSISGSISTNTFDIGQINTITIPGINSSLASNIGFTSTNTSEITTLKNTTIPTIQGDITANTTLANGAVSKTNPNVVGATNTWSGQNTWSQAGGNRFINDIEIGSGVPGAGYLHLEDNKVTLYCGGGTKGAEIDCDSAEFYGSVSMGFGGQIGKISITNAGQAVGNTVGFEINTDTHFNKSLKVGAVGDVFQTVINTDSTGVAGGKGFLVNSNHAEMNGSIISLGDLSDSTAVINAYSKLKISSAGLFKDLDPFAPTSSGDAGNRGDITWGLNGGVNYLYICVGGGGATNWGRVALSTGW